MIWLHFDTKSKLISIRSQVLHHFVRWYVKCVEKVPFRKSGHNYVICGLWCGLLMEWFIDGVVYLCVPLVFIYCTCNMTRAIGF